MFGLYTKRGWVEFFQDSQITITETNPLFDDDGGRSFSYSFKVPNSPKNIKLFKAAHRLDVKTGQYIYSVKLFIEGVPYNQGRIKIVAKSNKDITIRFEDTNREILEEAAKIKLADAVPDIMMPIIAQAGFKFKIEDANLNINQHAITNVTINDQKWQAIRSWINFPNWDQRKKETESLAEFINGIDPGAAVINGYTVEVTPSMRTPLALKFFDGLLTISDYTPFGPSAETNLLDFFNQENDKVAWPIIQNPSFYTKKENADWKGEVNYKYNNDTYSDAVVHEDDDANPTTWKTCYSPQFYLWHVLNAIADKLNLSKVDGSFFDIEDAKKILIYNDTALDAIIFEILTNNEVLGKNYGSQLIQSSNHLPDVSVKDFLFKLGKFFALSLKFDNRKLTLSRNRDQLSGAAIDWTMKTDPNYHSDIPSVKKGLLAYKIDKKEKANNPKQLHNYRFDHSDKKIDTGVLPLIDHRQQQLTMDGFVEKQINPKTDKKGSSLELSLHKTDDLRLLIYRGIRTNALGNTYRQASNAPLSSTGEKIGDLTLEFFDDEFQEESIVSIFWKEVLRLQNAPEVDLLQTLTIQDLLNAKSWKNSKRIIKSEQGKMTAVIKSIQIKVHATKGIGIAKVKYVRYDQ